MPILGIDASRAVKMEKTGVEWYSYFLIQAMARCIPEEWRVRLYAPTLPSPDLASARSPSPLGRGEGEGNWQWKRLRWPVERGWIQGRLSLEMMKSPPDVLFVPSRILPIVHPERTVTTIHDAVFLTHPELYDLHDLWLQKRGLEFALRFAKKIIVPSRATRDEVGRAGAREGQVTVIPHGVEVDHNSSTRPSPGLRPPSPVGRGEGEGGVTASYILFIGRIERKKNVLGLVHAMRRVLSHATPETAVKLVLAGQLGYGGEDVLQAIKTFKLADYVVHLGYVDRAQYRALLHNAAILAFPSFGEGFGFPVLEGMACGTPVVCSDIPVLHEVGGNAAQYVNPRDPEDIARGIQAVLKNEMLSSEMVKRGKERAQEYSWEKAARETWDVIVSL